MLRTIITRRLFFGLVFISCNLYAADQVFESVPLLKTPKGVIAEDGCQKMLDVLTSPDRKSVVLKETILYPEGDWTVSEVLLLTLKEGMVQGVNASTEFPGAIYEDSFTVKILVDGRSKTIKASVNDVLAVFAGKEKVKWSGDWLDDVRIFDKTKKKKTIKDVDMLSDIRECEYKEQDMPSLFGGYTVATKDDKAPQKSPKTNKLFILFCCLLSAMVLQQGSSV